MNCGIWSINWVSPNKASTQRATKNNGGMDTTANQVVSIPPILIPNYREYPPHYPPAGNHETQPYTGSQLENTTTTVLPSKGHVHQNQEGTPQRP